MSTVIPKRMKRKGDTDSATVSSNTSLDSPEHRYANMHTVPTSEQQPLNVYHPSQTEFFHQYPTSNNVPPGAVFDIMNHISASYPVPNNPFDPFRKVEAKGNVGIHPYTILRNTNPDHTSPLKEKAQIMNRFDAIQKQKDAVKRSKETSEIRHGAALRREYVNLSTISEGSSQNTSDLHSEISSWSKKQEEEESGSSSGDGSEDDLFQEGTSGTQSPSNSFDSASADSDEFRSDQFTKAQESLNNLHEPPNAGLREKRIRLRTPTVRRAASPTPSEIRMHEAEKRFYNESTIAQSSDEQSVDESQFDEIEDDRGSVKECVVDDVVEEEPEWI